MQLSCRKSGGPPESDPARPRQVATDRCRPASSCSCSVQRARRAGGRRRNAHDRGERGRTGEGSQQRVDSTTDTGISPGTTRTPQRWRTCICGRRASDPDQVGRPTTERDCGPPEVVRGVQVEFRDFGACVARTGRLSKLPNLDLNSTDNSSRIIAPAPNPVESSVGDLLGVSLRRPICQTCVERSWVSLASPLEEGRRHHSPRRCTQMTPNIR